MAPKLHIRCEEAPPETRSVAPGEYIIGRGEEADISLDLPQLSRKHAKLTVGESNGVIEDLGSSNGTRLDGQLVTRATVLRPGQTISLGPATLVLSYEPTRSPEEKRAALFSVLPPEFLGVKKYQPGRIVAQGGMGSILSTREPAIDRIVAMKVMLESASPTDVLRFVAEAKITGQLEHPNIVPVHELGIDENAQLYYTMKYVRGITLKKVIELIAAGDAHSLKKYLLGHLLTIFQKVCDGVAFAHTKGVIHRDLKPENVMIGDYGEVLVMDWGLAKVLDPTRKKAAAIDGRSIIRTGLRRELAEVEAQSKKVFGTPQFMAPEQCWGAHEEHDARTDVYALGAILYNILTLQYSVEGADVQAILNKVANGQVQPPLLATSGAKRLPHLPNGKVPAALSAITTKAMALNQYERYSSVPDFQADIETYQAGIATTVEKPGFIKQLLMGLTGRSGR